MNPDDFHCRRCGACCRIKDGIVRVSEAEVARIAAFLGMAGGEMSRSELLRRLHIDIATFRKVVLTLHMCEMIEEKCISRNKVIYTLKTAT